MRRPTPSFKVEVRRSTRRPSRALAPDAEAADVGAIGDDPAPEEFPTRDVEESTTEYFSRHEADARSSTFEEEMHQAEEALFGPQVAPPGVSPRTSTAPAHRYVDRRSGRDAFDALTQGRRSNRPDRYQRMASAHVVGVREDRPPAVSYEAAVVPASTGRVLESLNGYVDPVEQKLAAAQEHKRGRPRGSIGTSSETTPPKRRGRPPKTVQPQLWPDDVAIRARAAPQAPAVSSSPKTIPASVARVPTPRSSIPKNPAPKIPTPRTAARIDQRILYNAWTYRVVKEKAQGRGLAAEAVLRPGERWKRRLPAHAW